MSYNIRIASPPSKGWGYTDLNAIARTIRESGADLVALQEVDAFTDRSGKSVHQARELAVLTGMHYHFAKAIDRSNGDYGVAILSRFPIEKTGSFKLSVLSSNPENETRALAVVSVKTPLGVVVFASAHLDHLSDKERTHQIGQVNGFLKKYRRHALILGADLNMTADNPVVKNLSPTFEIPCTDCPLTFPADKPVKTLDYLMLNKRAARRFKRLSYQTLQETYASDHLPLIIDIEKN